MVEETVFKGQAGIGIDAARLEQIGLGILA